MTITEAIRFYEQQLSTVTDHAEAGAMTTLLLEHVLKIDRTLFHK
jgi:hypothetical protein